MKLRKLQLENFRNYQDYSHHFVEDKDITILVGPNGAGKTNLLEAVYMLSLGRSFRTGLQGDLIKWGSDYLRCRVEMESAQEVSELEVFYSEQPTRKKNFKINGVSMPQSDYFGSLLTVFFHPEDLNILYLQPSLRRRYLDILLSQTDRKYFDALGKYRRVLKQRNALLKQIQKATFEGANTEKLSLDLDAWDHEISSFGMEIILKRINFVEFLNDKLGHFYRSISDADEEVRAKYDSDIDNRETYLQKLLDQRKASVFQGKTLFGPHLDDLVFFINERNILSFASRGEFRSLLLALNLSEIDYIKEITGHTPVLLLDDVFSELDPKRQQKLLSSISGCQTIISTTNVEFADQIKDISEIHTLEK